MYYKMRILILLFGTTLALTARAQTKSCSISDIEKKEKDLFSVVEKIENCPKMPDVNKLCAHVSLQTFYEDAKRPEIEYEYQKIIYEASCIKDLDSDEQIAEKIRIMWKTYNGNFECSAVSFNLQKGSIMKLAVKKNFDSFIDDVIIWGLPLDNVDSNKQTVFDYILKEKEAALKNNMTDLVKTLSGYYDKLKKAADKQRLEKNSTAKRGDEQPTQKTSSTKL